jgi:hypothetical protein
MPAVVAGFWQHEVAGLNFRIRVLTGGGWLYFLSFLCFSLGRFVRALLRRAVRGVRALIISYLIF